MNKEAFEQVLDIVKRSATARDPRERVFDFGIWFRADENHKTIGDVIAHPCGTVGCIGGWGCVLQAAKTPEGREAVAADASYRSPIFRYAQAEAFFGIDSDAAEYLFEGYWHSSGTDAPTADVITKLENIIETGCVVDEVFDARYQ